MIITNTEEIISFMEGEGTDHKGRIYQDTLSWSDVDLEQCHDQVQWIFPLHEDSRMARVWPVITKETAKAGRDNEKVLANLRAAKDRFEKFLCIGENEDFTRQNLWCRPRNHNLLRITRIIRSLRLFGLEEEAKSFYDKATEAGNRCGIDDITRGYWLKALTEDVWETLQA